MSRLRRWLLSLGVLLLLVAGITAVDLITTRHVLPRVLIRPTPRALAHTFVEAITSGDRELAMSLTDGSPACVANMARTFEWYSPKYLGVSVDTLPIGYYYWYKDDPAREVIGFAFWDNDNWPATAGVATLIARHTPLGKRYTCGAHFSD